MEKWQKKSWLPLFGMAVIAACIFAYISLYPPIPPGDYDPQDSVLLETVLSVVRFAYPLVGSILMVFFIRNPFALRESMRTLRRLKAGRSG